MNVLTIESQAFQEIINKIDSLNSKIDSLHKGNNHKLSEKWLTNDEVAHLLNVSKRTLQNYRDTGILPFAQHKSKIYYRASDIEKYLEKNMKPTLK
ncbi:MAG: helix-turn-helix domain-containing protein [Bacteroidetes bacterium]|nr:helix-turn-helix domain-containing protein [Bacteroidota bacterium]